MTRPTIERLREVLAYEPSTGVLTWRVSLSNRAPLGAEAGWVSKGYRFVEVDSSGPLPAHVVALAIHSGSWPVAEVDHRNGLTLDNRADNLRDVPRAVNQQNRRRAAKHNKCGVLGVVLGTNGRFSARIRVNGKQRHLGCFGTAEQAHQVYLEAKRQLHPGCTL